MNAPDMRWRDYAMFRGHPDAPGFWQRHLGSRERNLLFVLGKGFDARMCSGVELVMDAGGRGRRDVVAIEYREGPTSPSVEFADRVERNWAALVAAVGTRGAIRTHPMECLTTEGRRVTSQAARDIAVSSAFIDGYTDVVVDVSAMPRSVYYPFLARLLHWVDSLPASAPAVNLHVLVAEDPALDEATQQVGVEEKAEFMASFTGGFAEEAVQTPKVWLPLLGKDCATQFDRILDLDKWDEVCPVLPSPARDPRRGDDIVIQFQRRLFDDLRLDPRDFLYASEHNPFEVYRRVRSAVLHYNRVFQLLGGCKVALSALSSKLMSIGPLLVAYELKRANFDIGVAHVECQGYSPPAGLAPRPEVFSLWIAGECYAAS